MNGIGQATKSYIGAAVCNVKKMPLPCDPDNKTEKKNPTDCLMINVLSAGSYAVPSHDKKADYLIRRSTDGAAWCIKEDAWERFLVLTQVHWLGGSQDSARILSPNSLRCTQLIQEFLECFLDKMCNASILLGAQSRRRNASLLLGPKYRIVPATTKAAKKTVVLERTVLIFPMLNSLQADIKMKWKEGKGKEMNF